MNKNEINKLLETYREQIDTIDREIVYLLSRRFDCVKSIGNIKKEYKINALQPGRWQKVLDKLDENAGEFGLNYEFLENIWNQIHKEALKLEEK